MKFLLFHSSFFRVIGLLLQIMVIVSLWEYRPSPIPVVFLLIIVLTTSSLLWSTYHRSAFLGLQEADDDALQGKPKEHLVKHKHQNGDELETALEEVSIVGKNNKRTLIITILNRAYAADKGMLDLFLRSLSIGQGTSFLKDHLLVVAVDQIAYDRCKLRRLHCYKLVMNEGIIDFSKEEVYMSGNFNKMMWRRTKFLVDILRRGYNFIFTDMDVMWLRNPFGFLVSPDDGDDDMRFSCDEYLGDPFHIDNPINTGFYFVSSNNRTISLFNTWYAARNESDGKKDQDILTEIKYSGVFQRLGLKVRYLDTDHFAGFCHNSGGFTKDTITVHANCCRSIRAKLADLKVLLEEWKRYNNMIRRNETKEMTFQWPKRKACNESWRIDVQPFLIN